MIKFNEFYHKQMLFSCFCSNKKMIKESILSFSNSVEKLVKLDKTIKLLNPISNEIIVEKNFSEMIVTTTERIINNKKYYVVCTKNIIYILDADLNEIQNIKVEEEILCSSSENFRPYFYIGCKSGRIIVISIRNIDSKFIIHEVHNIYCFKPVYNIAIHIEKKEGNIKRNIFAGYSRWKNEALQQVII